MKRRVVMAMSLIAFLAVTSGYAQNMMMVTGKITFPFTAGGKALPAGHYEFVRDGTGSTIRVVSGGKNMALVPIVTRLSGAIHTTPKDSHIVFDKMGDKYTLSEIWVPGQDGYMLFSTKGRTRSCGHRCAPLGGLPLRREGDFRGTALAPGRRRSALSGVL